MRETILHIKPYHNERWQRKGFLYIPTFMLYSGDKLYFEWTPNDSIRTLKIEIEKTDLKADYSKNTITLDKFDLENSHQFEIGETGLYNIPIENPKFEEGEIGLLNIIRENNSDRKEQRSPYPERFYKYSLRKEGNTIIKNATKWGYLTEKGECVLDRLSCIDNSLPLLFNSKKNEYHVVHEGKKRIDKRIYLWVPEGADIAIDCQRKEFENLIVDIKVEKKDRGGLRGKIERYSKFTSNEDSIYLTTVSIYSSLYDFKGKLPVDFCDIKIFGGGNSHLLDFEHDYKLIKVFNKVFNTEEIEPIKVSC